MNAERSNAPGPRGRRSRPATTEADTPRRHLVIVATEDWYVVSHRLAFVQEAVRTGHRVTIITRVREAGDTLRRAGADVIAFDWCREEPSWRLAMHSLRLRALLRALAPDSLLLVAMKPVLCGALASWRLAVPTRVLAISGLGLLFYGRSFAFRMLQPALRMALRWMLRAPGTTALVQNSDDARLVIELRGHEDGVTLVPGVGVDLTVFEPAPEPEGVPVVMLPARLLRAKGVSEFVEAATLLHARGVAVRMVLVGAPDEGSRDSYDAEQLQAWCASGAVEWWGHRRDMAATLREAHVVCLPSWGEGMPRSLLEAAACGRPVITTDVPGCREAIVDGETGILVPVRDGASLATAIERVVTNTVLRRGMGAAGRRRAELRFDQVGNAVAMLAACFPRQDAHGSGPTVVGQVPAA